MNRTFTAQYRIHDGLASMEFAGRTDGSILRDCYVRHAMHERDLMSEFESFRVRYFEELERVLRSVGGVELLPGVPELLDALARREDVCLGLGTGNYRAAAE